MIIALKPYLMAVIAIAWAGSLAGVWLWQARSAEIARAEAMAECAQAAEQATLAAVTAARERWALAQEAVDEAVIEDRARIAAELARAEDRAASLRRNLLAHIQATPLPADCRFDAARVNFYNETRGAR